MKPQLLKVSRDLAYSYSSRRDNMPDINNRWHFHPELELIYFKKGDGTQFIGDNISPFNSGDVMLLGANLPHYWRFDERYFDTEGTTTVDVCVIHFDERFWGDTLLSLPESKRVRCTLEQAVRGIHLSGHEARPVGLLLEQIINADGIRKITLLLEVLDMIGATDGKTLLASLGFTHNFQEAEKDRIHDIYNYALTHFKKKITLAEIAAVANISPNSFCKYFKSRSRKTFSLFLNEIRVGHACKLLIEDQLPVKEICYESGFYNFASFHQYFKQITGKSPLGYQKSFVKAQ